MRPTQPHARRSTRATLTAAALACFVGCTPEPTPQGPTPEEDVTLPDIAPPKPPGPPAEEGETQSNASGLRYDVERVEIDLDRPLNAVWALADESVLPPLKRAVWENNGLRLGKLSASDIPRLRQAVGPTAGTRRNTVMNIDQPTAIRSSSPIARPVPVDLTVPPMNIRRVWAERGRLRLLLREASVSQGRVELELMPQLYQPTAQLLPRTPEQRQLDGQIYDALSTTVTLAPNEVLLVGLYWPWQPPPEPITSFLNNENPDNTAPDESPDSPDAPVDGSTETDADNITPTPEPANPANPDATTPDAADETEAPEEPVVTLQAPPLDPSVGRALFAGQRFNRPVQVLLAITVDDGSIRVEPAPALP